MLYLLYGKDSFRSRQKLNELLSFFRSKITDLGIFKIDGDDFKESEFEELIRSSTLFEKKNVIVCENLLANPQAKEIIGKKIEAIANSSNIFIFFENEIDGSSLEALKPHAEKTQRFEPLSGIKLKKWFEDKKIPPAIREEIIKICSSDLWCASKEIERYKLGNVIQPAQKESSYKPFAICDAVGERNKTRTWVLLQEAMLSGIETEEVFYKILWQIKNLLLMKKLSQAKIKNFEKETSLHPFVIKKTLWSINNFTESELEKYSFELVKLYHNVRRGIEKFDTGLEKFLLEM